MSKAFGDLNPEQRRFVAICEWLAKMEKVSEADWIKLTSDDDKFHRWASLMFDKYEYQLTDVFIAELTLLRYFVPEKKSAFPN